LKEFYPSIFAYLVQAIAASFSFLIKHVSFSIFNIQYTIVNPNGWGGRIRTSGCRNQNPVPYRLATPQIPGWLTRVRCPAVQAITQIPAVFSGIDEFKIFLKDRIR
jgi:hypothetical protein